MSVLIYNGINLGMLRTEYMQAEPVLDALGNVDPLFTRVLIEVASVMHPNQTASNIVAGAGPVVNGVAIPQGDPAGLSAANLREALLQQRRPLIYQIGNNNVIVSPPINPQKLGAFLDRDCKEGPHVIDCRVTQIEGDFSFFITFKVETWITGFSNVLLSNRWAMTHSVDVYGLTTRYVNGQATIRADAIPFSGVQSVDDFRNALFLPEPPNFRRERVDCQVTPDGTVLSYQVVDKETGLAMGPNSVAITMHGNATAGTESTIKTIRQATNFVVKQLENVAKGAALAFLKDTLQAAVPVNKANVLIRVAGSRAATRVALYQLAVAVALDRINSAFIVSAYCTQSLDSDKTPWVEVRIELFPSLRAIVGGAVQPLKFTNQMNLADNITGGQGGIFGVGIPGVFPLNPSIVPPIASNNAQGVNPPLQSDAGTRGSYIGRMAVQTFAGPGAVPNAPPAEANSASRAPF